MNKIITNEDIEKIKKLIRERSSHKIVEILNNLQEIEEPKEEKKDGN